jgi:hypothetical protein
MAWLPNPLPRRRRSPLQPPPHRQRRRPRRPRRSRRRLAPPRAPRGHRHPSPTQIRARVSRGWRSAQSFSSSSVGCCCCASPPAATLWGRAPSPGRDRPGPGGAARRPPIGSVGSTAARRFDGAHRRTSRGALRRRNATLEPMPAFQERQPLLGMVEHLGMMPPRQPGVVSSERANLF